MVTTTSQTISGAKTYSSAPTFTTLTTNGGIFYGNASGTLLQTGSGATNFVLHGGTTPSYSAINLTTDVTSVLTIPNGGNGTAPSITAGAGISITGTWNNYTIANTTLGTVTSINASGGTTGFSFTGGPVTTTGTLTLSGTLVPANGGTGLSSLTPYAVVAGGATATGTLQQVSGVGTVGQVLTSNGAGLLPSWQPATGGGGVLPTRQNITSGSSSTGTGGGVNLLVWFNFGSTSATYNFTMPSSPVDQQTVEFESGGTLTSGVEVTALTITPNSGQSIISSAPFNTIFVGGYAKYRWNNAIATWFRDN